jgi:hypothetical protein
VDLVGDFPEGDPLFEAIGKAVRVIVLKQILDRTCFAEQVPDDDTPACGLRASDTQRDLRRRRLVMTDDDDRVEVIERSAEAPPFSLPIEGTVHRSGLCLVDPVRLTRGTTHALCVLARRVRAEDHSVDRRAVARCRLYPGPLVTNSDAFRRLARAFLG